MVFGAKKPHSKLVDGYSHTDTKNPLQIVSQVALTSIIGARKLQGQFYTTHTRPQNQTRLLILFAARDSQRYHTVRSLMTSYFLQWKTTTQHGRPENIDGLTRRLKVKQC
jgi:hypothetical protein